MAFRKVTEKSIAQKTISATKIPPKERNTLDLGIDFGKNPTVTFKVGTKATEDIELVVPRNAPAGQHWEILKDIRLILVDDPV